MKMRLLIGMLSILAMGISGCVPAQKPFSIDYKTDGSTFHLIRSCIESLTPKAENKTVFIKVRDSAGCSKPFNLFWERNVGKRVSVFFNGGLILGPTYIGSPMRTENGFYQAVESKSMFDKIGNVLN